MEQTNLKFNTKREIAEHFNINYNTLCSKYKWAKYKHMLIPKPTKCPCGRDHYKYRSICLPCQYIIYVKPRRQRLRAEKLAAKQLELEQTKIVE